MKNLKIRKAVVVYLIALFCAMGGMGMTCTHASVDYKTHDNQIITVSNKNLQLFLRGVQISSRSYTSAEKAFAVVVLNYRDSGDMEAATVLYNRFKPIDDGIVQSFELLSRSIGTTLKINSDISDKDMSVPQALIEHADDILAQMRRIVMMAEDFGVDLPPGFSDAFNIMERMVR